MGQQLYLGSSMLGTHELYVAKDFTNEEVDRGNALAKAVIDGGLSICKKCGAGEAELEKVCGALG